MRRLPTLLALAAVCAAVTAAPGATARSRCDATTRQGSFTDCFSGHYHGTGFLPMEETIRFRAVIPDKLRTNPLWKEWVADAARSHDPVPCANDNAIGYVGTFSFYNGGTFIACSRARPYMLSGYFRVHRKFSFEDEETKVTLTHGVFSGSADWDNVLELVFSDAAHQHFAQPEVVLGFFKN